MSDRRDDLKVSPPARNNAVRKARSASSRPTGFYILLSALALAGIAALGYVATRPKPEARDATPNVLPDTSNSGPPQGYLMGKPDAPVKILEFADFECPGCARFSTVTEPDVRTRLIETGKASITYFDFPLAQHRNTLAASNAAACADEQGRFWQMHDQIFAGQDEWNGEATSDPKSVFLKYAGVVSINTDAWTKCYDSRKYAKRINANFSEGMRRNVNSTPSFVIGNKLYAGALSYDELKAKVDSLSATAAVPPAPKK